MLIDRKGIDATCVDNLKESIYYVKALVSVDGWPNFQTHLGDSLLVRDTARRIVESVQPENLSRSQQVLVAELYYMVGQQVELDSMEEAIRAYTPPHPSIADMSRAFSGMSTIWTRSSVSPN